MKEKIVKRYYCDFCKKSGGHKGYMLAHEKRCTMNPDRICGLCDLKTNKQMKISEFIKQIKPFFVREEGYLDSYKYKLLSKEGFEKLKEITGNCPNCILATLRQCEADYFEFNYKKALNIFWQTYNEDAYMDEDYNYVND